MKSADYKVKNSCYKYLRPCKAKVINELTEDLVDKTGNLEVHIFSDCTIVPHYYKDKIKSDVSSIKIGDLPEYVSDGADLYSGNINNSDSMHGVILYGGYYRAHWGHILVNTMARIWYYYESYCPKIDKIIFVADNPHINWGKGNIIQLLEVAGIKEKIEIINKPTHFDMIIEPECSIVRFKHYSKEFMNVFNFVKKKALEISVDKFFPDKIFLTRSGLKQSQKNELNIEYLDKFFSRNGYTVLSPERMSLVELIHYFNNAKTIASICGTLAHNLIFAPSSAKIQIIERHPFINISQQLCNKSADLNAVLIDANQMPLQSSSIGSLFLYKPTKYLEQFILDNNMIGHVFPCDDKNRKKELKKFFKRYKHLYGLSPCYHEFDLMYGPVYTEAVLDSYEEYGKWLKRKCPLFFRDYFSFYCNPFLKKIAKTLYKFLKR